MFSFRLLPISKGRAPSVDGLKEFFTQRQDSASSKFPNDDEFKEGLISGDAYNITPKSKLSDILWELEEVSSAKHGEKIEKPEALTIEHIMPQTWTDDWPTQNGSKLDRNVDFEKVVERDKALHRLGNLTLITGALNSGMSNIPFKDKKHAIKAYSMLTLNKWFEDKERWTKRRLQKEASILLS